MDVSLRWSGRAIRHIARHGVDVEEVTMALRGAVYRRKVGDRVRFICKAPDRYLLVVLRPLGHDHLAEVVTARVATVAEKRLYLRRGKQR